MPHAAEIIRRINNPAPEVILPDSVDDRAPGQRIVFASDPVRERNASVTFGMVRGQFELPVQSRNDRYRARSNQVRRCLDVSPVEDVYLTRLATVSSRLDKGALSAIQLSNPFQQLPAEYETDLRLRIAFLYNLNP